VALWNAAEQWIEMRLRSHVDNGRRSELWISRCTSTRAKTSSRRSPRSSPRDGIEAETVAMRSFSRRRGPTPKGTSC
jgi:hypothetical protein